MPKDFLGIYLLFSKEKKCLWSYILVTPSVIISWKCRRSLAHATTPNAPTSLIPIDVQALPFELEMCTLTSNLFQFGQNFVNIWVKHMFPMFGSIPHIEISYTLFYKLRYTLLQGMHTQKSRSDTSKWKITIIFLIHSIILQNNLICKVTMLHVAILRKILSIQ